MSEKRCDICDNGLEPNQKKRLKKCFAILSENSILKNDDNLLTKFKKNRN